MKIKVKLPTSKYQEFVVNKSKASIGRSSKADISLPDESLSRIHAEIEISHDEFFVTDLGSANGVYLNDIRLPAQTKTKFTNYQELVIGQSEIQIIVEDNYKIQTNLSAGPVSRNEADSTGVTLTRKNALKKELKKTDKTKSSFKINPVPVIAFLLAAFGISYKLIYKSESSISEVSTKASILPDTLKNVPDYFLSLSEYEALDKLKSCSDLESCKSLGIDVDKGEGISINDKQAVIFFRTDFSSRFEKFKNYTKEDATKLVAIYTTLKSTLFEKLRTKDLGQIHIVLKNQDHAIIHAFRLHTLRFNKSGLEKALVLTDLVTALKNNSSDSFWLSSKLFIESKEY